MKYFWANTFTAVAAGAVNQLFSNTYPTFTAYLDFKITSVQCWSRKFVTASSSFSNVNLTYLNISTLQQGSWDNLPVNAATGVYAGNGTLQLIFSPYVNFYNVSISMPAGSIWPAFQLEFDDTFALNDSVTASLILGFEY